MTTVTQKAHDELIAGQRSLTEALMTVNSLQTHNTYGCACAAYGPCAYHAELTNRILEANRAAELVVIQLRKDIANPGRAV